MERKLSQKELTFLKDLESLLSSNNAVITVNRNHVTFFIDNTHGGDCVPLVPPVNECLLSSLTDEGTVTWDWNYHPLANKLNPSRYNRERQYPREAYDPTTRKGFEKRLCSMQRPLISVVSALNEIIEQVGDGTLFRDTHPHTDCIENQP